MKFDLGERSFAETVRTHGLSGRIGKRGKVLEPWVVEEAGIEEVKKQMAEEESVAAAIFLGSVDFFFFLPPE